MVGPVCATLKRWRRGAQSATGAAVTAAALASTAVSTAVGFLPSLRAYDQYAALGSIQARTVVVSGGTDPLTPPAHGLDLVAGIPGAQHVHVPGAGHMLPQEAREVLNDAIRRTMDGAQGSWSAVGEVVSLAETAGDSPAAPAGVAAAAGVAS